MDGNGVNQAQPAGSGTLLHHERRILLTMTLDEARQLVIDGINYAAYRETDSSLQDSDKNRLFGSEHYASDRPVYNPSPWAEGGFEEKMATLLVYASVLNRSVSVFADAKQLLEGEESVIGRVIRRAKYRDPGDAAPGISNVR